MALDKFGDIPITSQADKQGGDTRKKRPDLHPDGCISPAGKDKEPLLHDDISVAGVQPRPSKQKPLPGKRWNPIRTVRWGIFILALVVLYGVSAYFLVPALIQGSLAPLISKRLDRSVEINRIVFSPFTLQLFLTDITIGNLRGDLQGAADLLTCATLRCRLGIDRIFEGKVSCEEVVLEGVDVQIRREKTNFSDLVDVMNIFNLQFSGAADQVWPVWLDAGELTLSDGTITFNDVIGNKQYRVEQVELYFPGIDPKRDTEDTLPQLSAVINSSPVQAEAVRILNNKGQLETGLDLQIKDVFLPGYLDYLPFKTSRYSLSEGSGDVDLRVLFPADQEGLNKIVLSGESFVSNVRIVDSDARSVIAIPEIRFSFTVMPLAGQFQIHNIVIDQPELDVYAGRTVKKIYPGIPLADVSTFIATAIQTPALVRIEQMRADNGKVRFFFPESPQPSIIWDDVTFKLTEFTTPGWTVGKEESKEGKGSTDPSYFVLNVSDRADPGVMKGSVEGQIHPGRGIGGRFSLTQLDLDRYGNLLPQAGPHFDQGIGDIRFTYDFVPGGTDPENKGAHSFILSDGYLDVADYTLQVGNKEVRTLSGGSLKCAGLQADPSSKKLTCKSLKIAGSEIFTNFAQETGSVVDENGWQVGISASEISDSRLHTSFFKNICPGAQDLVLDNLSVSANNLNGLKVEENISVSATVGARGSIKLKGGYSLADTRGKVQVEVRNLDFRLFNPCLSAAVIPAVQQGDFNARGIFSRSSGEFTGSMSVNNLIAGNPKGPYVHWQSGGTGNGALRVSPFDLDLGDITITRPVIKPGLIDSDIPLYNFIKQGKLSFEHLSIDTIAIKDGRFSMPWPVVLPGYQPQLNELNGTFVSPGRDPMEFTLKGNAAGFADFSIKGKAGKTHIREYSLEIKEMNLTPFASFLQNELGLLSEPLQGEWYQDRTTSEQTATLVNRIRLQGVVPGTDSPFRKALALLVDEKNELVMELKDISPRDSKPSFLLPAIQRYLQHQAVRADISEQLLLQESLPGLKTPPQVFFEPGSSILRDPAILADYRGLFDKRPLLGVSLHSYIDEVSDRAALHEILQQEADRKRDAQNQSRALAKQKLLEKQKKMIEEIKEGKTAVVTEEISYEELVQDLEPLPSVLVEVPAAMLDELARMRAHTVFDYLVNSLHVAPERVVVKEQYGTGKSQVKITPVPYRKTVTQASETEDGNT